jgi:hypothetical protein
VSGLLAVTINLQCEEGERELILFLVCKNTSLSTQVATGNEIKTNRLSQTNGSETAFWRHLLHRFNM